ncbi:MAG: Gfo/Idh/MocA family oxidoreductase [Alphaproteobacteria bacterium]|nr:Gfo/Idh/MocA family oxidoreductase [Alphaproteobacteria bacterium]
MTTEVVRWGIFGVGRAGRARARAIAADPRAQLVGGWRGDPASVSARAFASAEALLAEVDAVAICSPNALHAAQARKALDAGVHALVEFPLAGSASEARALLQQAAAVGRVLHVEHIELLGPAAEALRAWCRGRRLVSGSVRFTSGHSGWLADPALALSVAHRNVARLHRLADAVGLPEVARVQSRGPHYLEAILRVGAAEVGLSLRHGPGLARHTEMALRLDDGASILQSGRDVFVDGVRLALPAGPGLFAADQRCATARILNGAGPYVDPDQVLAVLGLADDLRQRPPASLTPR